MKKMSVLFMIVVFIFIGCGDKKPEKSAEADLKKAVTKAVVDEAKAKGMYLETLKDIKTLGTALQAYLMEQGEFPELSSIEELYQIENFQKLYLGDLDPIKLDKWGNKFLIKFYTPEDSTGRDGFMIASSGSDGVFKGWEQKGTFDLMNGEDIVYVDGDFVYHPNVE